MSVPAAFIGVIVIWSTTPLAIQWSSEGWGFLFGVTGRMALGMLLCLLIISMLRQKIPLHKRALVIYLIAGLGIYGAMTAVYWGSQYIASGLVAVLFGLSPVVTTVMAALILKEACFTPAKIIGALLGVAGLVIIFSADINGVAVAWQGIVALLLSVFIHSGSTVVLKRLNNNLPAVVTTTGGLAVAVPLYIATWWFMDGELPQVIEVRNSAAMLYLAVFGTALGFSLYYYILKNMQASHVGLIPLVTPVLALLAGQFINGEVNSNDVWNGTMVILIALSLHQWGDQLFRRAKLLVPLGKPSESVKADT